MGEASALRGGGDEPLVVILVIAEHCCPRKELSGIVRELREIPGNDVSLTFSGALLVIQIFLMVSEELHVRFRHGRAGFGIHYVILLLAGAPLGNDGGVGDPDDAADFVAVLQSRLHPVGSGGLERRGDINAAVPVARTGLEVELP